MEKAPMTDLDKAEAAGALFTRMVGPFLDRYLAAKAAGTDALSVLKHKRAYERAHGKFNEQQEARTDG